MAIAQAAAKFGLGTYKAARRRALRRQVRAVRRKPRLVNRIIVREFRRKNQNFIDNAQQGKLLDDYLNSIEHDLDQDPSNFQRAWHAFKRLRALQVSWFLGGLYLPIQGLMFTIWMSSFVGFGAGFLVSWVVAGSIGSFFMLFSLVVYKLRFVDCWSGRKDLVFILCFTACWAPFFFIVPWPALWLLSVTIMQGRNNTQEEQFA